MKMITALSRTLGKGTILSLSSGKTSVKIGFIPCATITSKANRDPSYRRAPPFPYKEKNYSMVRSWFDRTTLRFDDNSKIIVVDGPIAVGKNAFAKQLAEDLDMLYVPGANMDSVYINSYGFDKRSLNDKLPPNLFQADEKSFARDPFHKSVPFFQFAMCELRLSNYIDALAHLMNTGQGVVMVRSWYSDMVFAEAMAKEKYMRKQVLNGYYTVRQELFHELLRPHLQIYLDIPVPVVQERIKKRGHDWEVNGKGITTSFLNSMEDAYKRKYLPEIETHSELLIYDWTEGGDLELVVEDIERLDFDKYTVYDSKMADWRFPKEQAVSDLRMTYTNTELKTLLMMSFVTYPLLDCPELYMSGDEQDIFENEIMDCPGSKYIKGYNADMGDTGILFKTKMDKPRYPNLEV